MVWFQILHLFLVLLLNPYSSTIGPSGQADKTSVDVALGRCWTWILEHACPSLGRRYKTPTGTAASSPSIRGPPSTAGQAGPEDRKGIKGHIPVFDPDELVGKLVTSLFCPSWSGGLRVPGHGDGRGAAAR